MHREVIKARLENGEPDLSVFHVDGDIYDNVSRCKCGKYIQRMKKIKSGKLVAICPEHGEQEDYNKRGLTLDGVNQFAKGLKTDEKDARLEGKPSYLSTLVLPKLDRNTHCKPRFKIPLNWIMDISIDYHPQKPWAVLFVATEPRNFHWACEHMHEKGGPKHIAEEIVRRIQANHYNVNSITIDPLSKGDENAHDDLQDVFKTMEKVFASYGYTLETASKNKESGITMINDLLMTENEMPALFFFNDMGIVIQQLEDWMYNPDDLKPSKKEDEFCELMYRIALKNTQWYDPREKDEPEYQREEAYDPLGRQARA
jgi:hypothetical protein